MKRNMLKIDRFAAVAGTAVIAAALALLPTVTQAQDYPNKPIKLVVPFPAGGSTDSVARSLAPKLMERFGGKSFVVDNKPGAAGLLGVQELLKAAANKPTQPASPVGTGSHAGHSGK